MWLLLRELGIMDDAQNRQRAVVTEKRLSQTLLASGRLDAEYYQPKYDYLDTHTFLQYQQNDWDMLLTYRNP